MDHVGDTASFPGQKKKQQKQQQQKTTYHQVTWVIRPFMPGQKIHIITFGVLGGLAFDYAYDIPLNPTFIW